MSRWYVDACANPFYALIYEDNHIVAMCPKRQKGEVMPAEANAEAIAAAHNALLERELEPVALADTG